MAARHRAPGGLEDGTQRRAPLRVDDGGGTRAELGQNLGMRFGNVRGTVEACLCTPQLRCVFISPKGMGTFHEPFLT